MYFIAKGSCLVYVNDKFADRIEKFKVRELSVGSHFGEISMLYQTARSATVISHHYLTCAKVSRHNYEELLLEFPSLNELAKQAIIAYDDPLKVFMEMSLNQMDFFKDFPKIVKNEWIFKMKYQAI